MCREDKKDKDSENLAFRKTSLEARQERIKEYIGCEEIETLGTYIYTGIYYTPIYYVYSTFGRVHKELVTAVASR